jgi:TRAP-type C4-dicarboxylate transport system substrate-binding protein
MGVIMERICMAVSFSVALFLIVSLVSPAAYAQEKPVSLTFSNFLFAQAQNSVLAEKWCREVETRTSNKLKITIYHGGTLTPGPKIYDGVVNGLSDIGMSVFAYTKGKFPLTEVIDLPIGHTSGYTSTKLINEYYKKFHPAELDDVKIMYITAHGPGVMMTKRPVYKLEDLKGMKIRGTGLSGKILAALGAEPVVTTMGEAYNALAKGQVEGVLSPMEGLEQWKFQEVVNYVTESTGAAFTSAFFVVMNKARWNSLPGDVQKVIEEINREWTEKQGRQWDEIDNVGREYGIERGIKIIKLSKEENDRWAKQVRPLLDDYVRETKQKGLPGDEALEFSINYLTANRK